MLWPPVISGWQTANVSLLLAFGIALAWRYRDRPIVSGALVGVMISLKLFLWPLAGWLLLTRRWRATGWAVVWAVAANAFAWAVLGFDQLSAYATLVHAVTKVEEATAYTPLALVLRLGGGIGLADAVAALVAIVIAAACVVYAAQRREPAVLLCVITLSLLATPVVWRHYFVLLLVPLAIFRPRLSAAWAIPIVLLPVPVTDPNMWQLVLTLAAMGLLVYTLLRWPELVAISRVARSRARSTRQIALGSAAGGSRAVST